MRLHPLLSAAVLCSAGLISTTFNAHASTISVGLQQAGYNSGNVTTVATDGGTGSVLYSGAYGTFTVNNITALGAPALAQGTLSTTSVQLSSSTAGTLYVWITEQGLTSPTGLTSFLSGFTSNVFLGAPNVTETTYYSNTNALYNGTQLASQVFASQGSTNATSLATLTGTYSETVRYAIATSSASSVNDTINLTAVAATPEPSSLLLLGTGLIGTATMVLRRRKLIA